MRIILATNNLGKVSEMKSILKNEVYSLSDLGINVDVIEDSDTLIGNAKLKAEAIAKIFPDDIIIADDTGLFIEALNFEPGIFSARYAGDACNSDDNIDKVLENMQNIENRRAYFETVMVVYKMGEFYEFSGKLYGEILNERHGSGGFGYDPIFYVKEYSSSLAQITKEQKNKISHRGKAITEIVNSNVIEVSK